MTTAQFIRNSIQSMPTGQLFTPTHFAGSGSRASVDQSLMRLTQTGNIERISHGLYMVPRLSRFGLKTMPSPDTVANAIAASEGATIEVHGAEAAHRFGFTTQMPVQPVYNTTGSSRAVQFGKLTIHFRHVTARKLVLAGRPAGQALAALWYLGKEHINAQAVRQIQTRLPAEEFTALKQAKTSMPSWMIEAFRQFEQEDLNNG